MDIEKLRKDLLENSDPDGPCIEDDLMQAAATALSTLQAENEKLRTELECVTAERNAAQALLAERSGVTGSAPITTAFGIPLERIRELVEADEWIDPAVELPPDDDMVLAIVSGKPADNITLEDAYELASYGSEGWIIEQYELWETPTVTWWRPLPDPPEKKKEER